MVTQMNLLREYVQEFIAELKLDKGLIRRSRKASSESLEIKQKMANVGRELASAWLVDAGLPINVHDEVVRYGAMQYMKIYNSVGSDHRAAAIELQNRLNKRFQRSAAQNVTGGSR